MLASDSSSGTSPPVAQQREILIFKLGDEEYGIDIRLVQELRGWERITRIADAPAYMRGVINLRGMVVPIADMRVRFGLAQSADTAAHDPFTVVIVLSIGKRTIGIMVDSVSDVMQLAPAQIRPVPPDTAAFGASHWTGMGMLDERMVILLDIAALISNEDSIPTTGPATLPLMH